MLEGLSEVLNRYRQISSTRVRFTLTTAWAANTEGGPKTVDGIKGASIKVGDRVILTDSPGDKPIALEFDYGDATATLSGARDQQTPYTPLCQTAGGPDCIHGWVREIVTIKQQTTIFVLSEFEHDYVFGDGPYEARISGCCRPPAQTTAVQGLINNPGGPFKIASTVYLKHPTWAESPFFLQVPTIPVSLATAVTVPITAGHPRQEIRYRMGTTSDFGADLSTTVPLDKRGPPVGAEIDAVTGHLTLKPLYEPQLYSIVVVAELDSGETATVDFYIEV